MVTVEVKRFIEEYWDAISGKPKPRTLLERYISDREFINHIMDYEKAFPRYDLIAEDYICENDKIVVRARVKGRHEGDLMGIPPTGRRIDLPFTAIYKVKDEKIIKGWLFIDRMELMEQLGIPTMN